MSQILESQELPTAQVLIVDANLTVTAITGFMASGIVDLKEFDETAPVKIVNDKLQVNEKMLEEDKIYPVNHNGQEFFVRKHKGITEIFQLSDTDV